MSRFAIDLATNTVVSTYDTYRSGIALHLKPRLGDIRLQSLRVIDVEHFLAKKAEMLAPAALLDAWWANGGQPAS